MIKAAPSKFDPHTSPSTLNVINLWAGPGAGKSTTAAGLFNLMKLAGLKVELVTEFAKDLTYQRDYGSLTNSLHLLGEQDQRLRRLVGHVDWCITDSPLPLSNAYAGAEYGEWFHAAVTGAYSRYTNWDFLVLRVKDYQHYGRNQTASQAMALDNVIANLFFDFTEDEEGIEPINAWEIAGDIHAPYAVAERLPIPALHQFINLGGTKL